MDRDDSFQKNTNEVQNQISNNNFIVQQQHKKLNSVDLDSDKRILVRDILKGKQDISNFK